MVLAVVASAATAEPRHRDWQERHDDDRGGSSGDAGAFWGGVLGGWLSQAMRPDREAQDVEGELEPWTETWLLSCGKRYKSFDEATGTYLSYDGNRYFCK